MQAGTARVHVGDSVRVVHGGATVLIPVGTTISASNIGGDTIHMVAIFSAPGFEDFMRDASALEVEKNVPLTQSENDEIGRAHSHHVIYTKP